MPSRTTRKRSKTLKQFLVSNEFTRDMLPRRTKDYVCYRSGEKKVVCLKDSPKTVDFQLLKQHNFAIGQLEDFQHLSLSKSTKSDYIQKDYQQTISRLLLNVGRMGPEERRRREMDAEAINNNILALMVKLEEPGCYSVASFTTEEVKYKSTVENNVMTDCSCADFNGTKHLASTSLTASDLSAQLVSDGFEN
ncbi:hypothetical protein CU098_008077, partial [Rhizopus stolonifer]